MLLQIKITKMMIKKWTYRMLIIGPSESGKTNLLLNLIQKDSEAPIDRIYLYA